VSDGDERGTSERPSERSSDVKVLAPVGGRVVALADVPDPVFAEEMVGPGAAVEPTGAVVDVVAPVAGRIVKLHPHAFVLMTDDGVGVLVHLGIDTVRLEGRGFELLASEGDTVAAGDTVVRWDPSTIEDGMSSTVPVVLMDRPKGSVTVEPRAIEAGAPLFDVP
jgi:PTS system glucose-specific IIA component